MADTPTAGRSDVQVRAGIPRRARRIVHVQLWEATADQIRSEILAGDLPVGTKLNEIDLAQRYGVSRVPVREALRHLASSGLVAFIPRRGAYVSTPEDSDYEELYVARDAIESAAVRVAIARVTDDELADLQRLLVAVEDAYAARAYEAAWAVDLELHRRIVEIAGNRRLLAFFDQLTNVTLLLHHHALREGTYAGAPPPELHRAIVAAIEARDEDAAAEAIERHFGYAADQPLAGASRR
jgi:DNA-binding GntR family transcriptional regulator